MQTKKHTDFILLNGRKDNSCKQINKLITHPGKDVDQKKRSVPSATAICSVVSLLMKRSMRNYCEPSHNMRIFKRLETHMQSNDEPMNRRT